MFWMSLMTATGLFIVLLKLGILRFFRIKETRRFADGGLDMLTTFGLIAIMAGTFSGVMIAMMSGLMLSGMFFATRLIIKPTKSIGGTLNGITNWFRKVPSVLRKSPKHAVA